MSKRRDKWRKRLISIMDLPYLKELVDTIKRPWDMRRSILEREVFRVITDDDISDMVDRLRDWVS